MEHPAMQTMFDRVRIEPNTSMKLTMPIDVVWCPGQNKIIAPPPFFHGYREKHLKESALTSEMHWDQTAMGLPPITLFLLPLSH
jgi:hypothetical protein